MINRNINMKHRNPFRRMTPTMENRTTTYDKKKYASLIQEATKTILIPHQTARGSSMPKQGKNRDMLDRPELLKWLGYSPGINITTLAHKTGLTWSRLKRLLSELVQGSIVRESRLELNMGRRIRLFFLIENRKGALD